jgi:FkbM family methyltransferase
VTLRTITASQFAHNVLEHALLKGLPLPESYAGMTPHEVGFFNYFVRNVGKFNRTLSKSQLCQDLWAVYLLDLLGAGEARKGFFVEFGAYDGITLSNTYLLEMEFGWSGILAEPTPKSADACSRNRRCVVDSRCVWRSSGQQLSFNEVPGNQELATVVTYEAADMHSETRRTLKRVVEVPTVSLSDLLSEHNAPQTIDYVSIDTEGSEYDILESFDFSKYQFLVLSVEHNFTAARSKLNELLTEAGMIRVLRSVELFDDIYIHKTLVPRNV